MATKGIREYDAKRLLSKYITDYSCRIVLVDSNTDFDKLLSDNPWLADTKLVCKPDQLIGKKCKHNLVLLNADYGEVVKFINENMGRNVILCEIGGKLTHFIIEPHIPHNEEYYVAIRSFRDKDVIYYSPKGGINIEEDWSMVKQFDIPVLCSINDIKLPGDEKVQKFVKELYKCFVENHINYLEINPFAFSGSKGMPLGAVLKVDSTAEFECSWGFDFPVEFGRMVSKEEEFINELDSRSGASLKLTLLRPHGKIWTMVAGGGASVIYADTICDLGYTTELANYGEYSGNPTDEETYLYAKTILDSMLRRNGKVLLIGGGIANFTDVAKTFNGIIKALTEYAAEIKNKNVKIFVRRGGPNYKLGLENMKKAGEKLGLDIKLFGPDMHMTRIVQLALKELENV